MAGFQTGGDDEIIAGINVTPLVDVVLVLLIIFMVTTSYVVQTQIQVDLPKAASGESEVQSTLTFQVKKDGTYLLDNDEATLDEIGSAVVRALEQDEKVRAVIAADKKVEYRRVVDLIDTLRSNGLDAFALNIDREKSGS